MSKPESSFRIVIPARYGSTRFPGKALADLDGWPVIRHVHERALASGAAEVIIATDDRRIADAAGGFGAQVAMTRADHETGTDRTAEVAERLGWDGTDIVVNVQGDMPFIPSRDIAQVAGLLAGNETAALATLCTPIEDEREYADAHVVKVVFDSTGRALYFSRASIPARAHGQGELPGAWRHVGIYAYRVDALCRLTQTPPCRLERTEKLEQLRALWIGMNVLVAVAADALGPDIDTPADLAAAERFIGRCREDH
ncbi:MAG: 3-deoxy-manno-octulosonate cytidylyltransferase [Gammaproteobacteria bacterium]